jgi:hypothetical protein
MKLRVVRSYLNKASTYVEAPYGIVDGGQAPGLHGLKEVLDQRSSGNSTSGLEFRKQQNDRLESQSEQDALDTVYQQFLDKIKGQ